ncbi:MAG: translation initiation factor IF-3 [Ruminococcaceae bacterium]|nr:translation initiation factor IF-3 [Oscillospiraceae bacterium]
MNEDIREKEVRVIGPDGDQLGIMTGTAAKKLAAEKDLDLVMIAPQGKPPVCKIMDYGKYKFELAKREKEQRKNQKVAEVKEVRLSPSIDTHDFETKLNNALKFLKSGDKVKVAVRFRGREMQHTALGKTLLDRFKDGVEGFGVIDRPAKMEGRNMVMFIAPTAQK